MKFRIRVIYFSVTIFWIAFLGAFNCIGQCEGGINPITGENIRYSNININGAGHYISLSNSGGKIVFSYINRHMVDPQFRVPINTPIQLIGTTDTLTIFTKEEAKSVSGKYSVWAPVENDDLKKFINLEQIRFSTSEGPKIIKLKTRQRFMMNAAANCVK